MRSFWHYSLPLGMWLLSASDALAVAQNTSTCDAAAQNTTAGSFVGWDAGPSRRGTLRLLWSCVATMFTCTWTVLHMNVPGYEDSVARRMARKVKWLAINILFPEFILSKSVCDLRLALDELRRFDIGCRIHGPLEWRRGHCKGSWEIKYPPLSSILFRFLLLEWPPAHSNELANMSPFSRIRQPSCVDPRTDLDSKDPDSGENGNDANGKQTVPEEYNKEPESSDQGLIEDKSGHSELLNPYWTVVHSYYAQMGGILCLHKQSGRKGLMGSFPFASPAMIWAFDWANDQHPLKEFTLRQADIQDRSKADWLAKGISMLQITWLIISVTVRASTGLPITQLEISAFAFSVMAIGIYMANWWKPKDVLRPSVQSASFKSYEMNYEGTVPFVQSFTQGIHWLRSTRHVNSAPKTFSEWNFAAASRVENDLVWMDGEPPYFFIMVGISSLAFNGMHCIAWNFDFPTQAELVCWRVASLVGAILPITVLGINYILDCISKKYGKVRWNNITVAERCENISGLLTNTSSLAYMGARLTVIVLMFSCLRSVPTGVYTMTPWTRFIPKIS